MKSIIIRKPKFMRSEIGMKTYIDVAETIGKEACRPELNSEQRCDLLKKVGECINKASKAGGFLNTKDFLKWMELHSNT